MDILLKRLFPICRSITGNGVRETLRILQEHVAIEIRELQTGTQVFDWTVPREWNVRNAYIEGPDGKRIADFSVNNLHLMSYSVPVDAKLSLGQLREHLYSIPEQPDLIPYKTSYYEPRWGFCLTHNELQSLKEGEYHVVIDSTLIDGSLTYGELILPGKSKEEVLLSCYVCHPSMANDNLSGVVLLTALAKVLSSTRRRFSYRLLFVPETIGALAWLAQNQDRVQMIRHGLVATCVGDNGQFTYKRSRHGNREIDLIVQRVLRESGKHHTVIDFFPMGSDERQYCSPGFDLPVGSLMRTMYYKFPQYHTSADNLDLVKGEHLSESISMYVDVLDALESTDTLVRVDARGEPQIGRRGLYDSVGGAVITDDQRKAIMWVLNFSDGTHSLLDIAERSGLSLPYLTEAARLLQEKGLLRNQAN